MYGNFTENFRVYGELGRDLGILDFRIATFVRILTGLSLKVNQIPYVVDPLGILNSAPPPARDSFSQCLIYAFTVVLLWHKVTTPYTLWYY